MTALPATSRAPSDCSRPARVFVTVIGLLIAWASILLASAPAAHGADVPRDGVWPLQPRPPVVSGFDPPDTPYGAGHRGVDLGGHVGQPVHAALAGRISFAGRLAGRGVVVVDHGGRRTTYEPVEPAVHVGDQVGAGSVIGHLQLFGSHCFPRACLHWGLIEGVQHYLDPLTLVGAAPVRLLPLRGPAPPLSGFSPVGPAVGRAVGPAVGIAVGPPGAAGAAGVHTRSPVDRRLALGPLAQPGRPGLPGPF